MLSAKHAVMTVVSLPLIVSCLRPVYAGDLASTLHDLDVTVLSNDERQELAGMLSRDMLLSIGIRSSFSSVLSRNCDFELQKGFGFYLQGLIAGESFIPMTRLTQVTQL